MLGDCGGEADADMEAEAVEFASAGSPGIIALGISRVFRQCARPSLSMAEMSNMSRGRPERSQRPVQWGYCRPILGQRTVYFPASILQPGWTAWTYHGPSLFEFRHTDQIVETDCVVVGVEIERLLELF